jgi:hypothetical protein
MRFADSKSVDSWSRKNIQCELVTTDEVLIYVFLNTFSPK